MHTRARLLVTRIKTDKEKDFGSVDGISSLKIAEKLRLFLLRDICMRSPHVFAITQNSMVSLVRDFSEHDFIFSRQLKYHQKQMCSMI